MGAEWATDMFGVVLLVLGGFLLLRFRKRRFDRTNSFGIEQFASYWTKIRVKVADAVIAGASVLFGCSGVLILAFNHAESWGWIVIVPILAIAIFTMLGT